MATRRTNRLLTDDRLFDLPDGGNRYEMVQGRLVLVPPDFFAAPSVAAPTLATSIGAFVHLHRLGICGSKSGGVKTASNPDTVRAPGLTFI